MGYTHNSYLSQTCATFVNYGVGPLATFCQEIYNLSQFQTGLIVSAVNIGPIFSMLIFGNIMDKYGERWVVGIGSILLGLTMLITIPVNEYIYLLIVLAFVGVWYGTWLNQGSSAIISGSLKQKQRTCNGNSSNWNTTWWCFSFNIPTFFFYHYGLSSVKLTQAIVAIAGGIIF